MKKVLLFLLTLSGLFASGQGLPISHLPAIAVNPAGGAVPISIGNKTYRIDAGLFGYNCFDSVRVAAGPVYDTFKFYNRYTHVTSSLLYLRPLTDSINVSHDVTLSGTGYPSNPLSVVTNPVFPTFRYTSVLQNYSILASDYFIDCVSGVDTLTLPSAAVASPQKSYIIKNSAAGRIAVVLTTSGQLIDSTFLPVPIPMPGVLRVFSDGVNWKTW